MSISQTVLVAGGGGGGVSEYFTDWGSVSILQTVLMGDELVSIFRLFRLAGGGGGVLVSI